MPRFKAGDGVRAPHPLDAVSGKLYPGTVTTVEERTIVGEVHELVTIDFGDGHTATVDADGVERA